MASIINASSTGSGGIVQTADASGVLQLQSNGTVALSISGAATTLSGNLTISNTLSSAGDLILDAVFSTLIKKSGSTNVTINQFGLGLAGSNLSSGVGVAFPATQSASSDANTLDDYEEGTWTPSLGGTATYSQQAGTYKKVGALVYVSAILQVAILGTGSASQISGFPFACSAGPRNALSAAYWASTVGNISYLAFYLGSGTTSNLVATIAAANTVQDGYGLFQSGTYVMFSGCYHAS